MILIVFVGLSVLPQLPGHSQDSPVAVASTASTGSVVVVSAPGSSANGYAAAVGGSDDANIVMDDASTWSFSRMISLNTGTQ